MKKNTIFLVFLLMILSLTGCGKQVPTQDNMTIQPSHFSEETQKVLEILDDEICFFDYLVDDTIKSMSIDIWQHKDGAWISLGKSYGNIEQKTARIAIRINENSYDIFDIDNDGHTKVSYQAPADFFKTENAIIGTRLVNETKIIPEQEIVLWLKLGVDSNTTTAILDSSFRDIDCESGLAVTVTFSTEELN